VISTPSPKPGGETPARSAGGAWEFLGRERLVAYFKERLFFVSWPRVAEMPEETANITVLRRFKTMRGAQAHARSRTKEMVAIDPEGAALGIYSYEVCSEERGRLP
jgi:hypothetical protein